MLLQAGAVVHETAANGEVVYVVGDIDQHNVGELDVVMRRALAFRRDVTVDLTHCRYIGSLGLRVLLRGRQEAAGTFATLVDPGSSAARLLEIAKLQGQLGVRFAAPPQAPHAARLSGDRVHVVALENEWDLSRGNELRERLDGLVMHPRAIVDLSNLTYMDQFCIGMLVRARTQRVAKGFPPACLVLPAGNARRVLGVGGFRDLWIACETLDEALQTDIYR